MRYIRQKCGKTLTGSVICSRIIIMKKSFCLSSQSRGFFIIVQTLSKNVRRGLFLNQISADFINLISHSFVFPLFTSLLTSHIHSTVSIFLRHPFTLSTHSLPSPSLLPPVASLLMALLIFSSSFVHFFHASPPVPHPRAASASTLPPLSPVLSPPPHPSLAERLRQAG